MSFQARLWSNPVRAVVADNMIKTDYSTIGPMGTIIAQALASEGVDPEPLFREAGFELAALNDPSVRMPAGGFRTLLTLVEQHSSDPTFGLTLARFIHPTSFYSMGIAGYCSNTLGEYLKRLVKYYRVVTTNDVLVEEIDDDALYHLRAVRESPEGFSPIREDGIAAIITTIVRVALHREFNPTRVHLARPRPEGLEDRYREFFHCPVVFDAEFTELVFPVELLEEPLASANPELAEMYERLTVEYLEKMDKADFPARVHNELIRLLPTGVSGKEQVADALNMSTRTLYNKLEAAGTTYREVLDDTRRRLAEQYIGQGLPIYEIAYLIGFSDTANFSRAFKKWTGQSPMEFRQAAE